MWQCDQKVSCYQLCVYVHLHLLHVYCLKREIFINCPYCNSRVAIVTKFFVYLQRFQKLAEERLATEVEKVKAREDGIKEKEKLLSQRFNTEVEK